MKKSEQRQHWCDAVDNASVAMALIEGDKIAHNNAAFNKLCKKICKEVCEKIYEKNNFIKMRTEDLFIEESAMLFKYLEEDARKEGDRIVLTMKSAKEVKKGKLGKEVLVQTWPIDEKNRYLMSLIDIDNLDEFSKQRLPDIDQLTELPNRGKARLLLEVEKKRITDDNSSGFCLVIGDIDNFKRVNDNYGHIIGDEVLKHITKIISNSIRMKPYKNEKEDKYRKHDWVARWGGEEFFIFLRGNNLKTARKTASEIAREIARDIVINRVHEELAKNPFKGLAGNKKLPITMSFGIDDVSPTVATAKKVDRIVKDAVNEADKRLYQAKAAGRHRTITGLPDDEKKTTERLAKKL